MLSVTAEHTPSTRSPRADASQQSHRSNHGQTHTLHDHSPSHGRGPAPSTTFKKTDTPQSHGDRHDNPRRIILFDVMDTLVIDPFFTGVHGIRLRQHAGPVQSEKTRDL